MRCLPYGIWGSGGSGETRQGGVKRPGTEAPRSHQLEQKIAWSAQHNRKMTHLSPDSFERPGGGGDHTRAHQPLRPRPAASAYGFLASEKSKP